MHSITDDEFAEEAEEEEIKQANQEEQTAQTEPMTTTSGKGKAGPKAKPKNPKSFQTKPVAPKPNRE